MSKPLTIETKIRFQRVRDGRKRIAKSPAAPPPPLPEPVPRAARLMALAIHFNRMIREGAVGSYLELARLTGTSPAWITAIMKLANVPVPEQEGGLLWTGPEESKPPTVSPAACRAAAAPHRPRAV